MALLVHVRGEPAMRQTQELLGADRVTEFRERLRNARGELLRTVLLTGDEMRGLGDREPGTLIEDSARGVMTDLVAGSFGACEICGAPISLSRLRAIPWARHCLACQFQQERRA